MSNKFSDQEISFLLKHYAKKGAKFCAKKLNRSASSIAHKASRLHISVPAFYRAKRIMSTNGWKHRIHKNNTKVDYKLFTENFTKESVYILGLIWADGHVAYKKHLMHEISLTCAQQDMDNYKEHFNTTGTWNFYSFSPRQKGWKPATKIYTSNKNLCMFLLSHQYGPNNKQSATKILNLIPDKLKHYWFLGLVDGDGCFYFNNKYKLRQFTITGPYNQNWTFVESLFKTLNIKYSIQCLKLKNSARSTIRVFGRNNILMLGNYLYKDFNIDHIGLKRKHSKWKKIIM